MAKKKKKETAKDKLNENQALFCHLYILEGKTAKEAYMQAFPESSERSASPNASRLLSKPHIKAYCEELLERQKETLDISDKLILNGIMQLAFGEDVSDAIRLKALDKLAKIQGLYSQEINVTHSVIQVGIVDDDTPKLENNNNGQIIGASYQEIEPCVIIDEDEKEDGVFIIYAIENERFMEFDDIPKQYIDEISNHYDLPCYDDTKDKRDPINDTDYDGETNTDIFLDRKNDVIEEDLKEAKEILKENGFKEKDHFYTNGKNTNIYLRHTTSYVFSIGFAEQSFKNEDIDRMVKIKSGLFNKLESVNAKYTQVEYERIIATFKNKDSDISYDIRFDIYVDGGNGQIINAEDNEKVTQAVYKLYEEKGIDVTQKIDSESIDFLYNFKYDPSAEVEMKPLDEYDDEIDELDLDLDLDPEYEDFDFSLESFGKRSK